MLQAIPKIKRAARENGWRADRGRARLMNGGANGPLHSFQIDLAPVAAVGKNSLELLL